MKFVRCGGGENVPAPSSSRGTLIPRRSRGDLVNLRASVLKARFSRPFGARNEEKTPVRTSFKGVPPPLPRPLAQGAGKRKGKASAGASFCPRMQFWPPPLSNKKNRPFARTDEFFPIRARGRGPPKGAGARTGNRTMPLCRRTLRGRRCCYNSQSRALRRRGRARTR